MREYETIATMREYERFKELVKDIPHASEREKKTLNLFQMTPRYNYAVMFENGWGFDIFYGYGSYGYEEGLLELAVIKAAEGNKNNSVREDWYLHYKNPVAEGDVVGHLTADEVIKLAKEIASWTKDQKWEDYEEER